MVHTYIMENYEYSEFWMNFYKNYNLIVHLCALAYTVALVVGPIRFFFFTGNHKACLLYTSLVRMAMLTEKKNRLSRMKGVRELVRNSVYRSEPEFTKRNYDATLVEAEYRKTSDELVRLQMALDKANMSIEFDVDI